MEGKEDGWREMEEKKGCLVTKRRGANRVGKRMENTAFESLRRRRSRTWTHTVTTYGLEPFS